MNSMPEARFDLGRLVMTRGAQAALEASGESPMTFLRRHAQGDWGDVGSEDRQQNDAALEDGSRLLSAYRTQSGVKLWVITEAADSRGHRLATTLLLPEEY